MKEKNLNLQNRLMAFPGASSSYFGEKKGKTISMSKKYCSAFYKGKKINKEIRKSF